MPLLLPTQRGVLRESNFTGRPATTWGTILTSDGTAHVEPATETQLIASTSFDTDWVNIWLHTNNASATDSDSLVNIKVGAAASEVTIIPNLLAGWVSTLPPGNASGMGGPKYYGFPLRIPAGTRISATHRSVRISAAVTCMIELLGGGQGTHWTGTTVEAIGADTATSSGTYVTLGGASEGTLTRLGASDGAATVGSEWGFVQPMLGGNTDTTMNAGLLTCDLGTSAAVIPGLDEFIMWSAAQEVSGNMAAGRYCNVPVGTILHLRAQTSATAEAMAFVAYGVS